MSTPLRRPVASLWIGEKLQYLNQLCLLSHVHQGHPTTLYCTDTVTNVPEGVIVRVDFHPELSRFFHREVSHL